MILLYTKSVTPRWKYTLDFVFRIREIDYQLTDDKVLFLSSAFDKFHIDSSFGALLNGSSINSEMKDMDLLSQLFFVLTRMEEYFPEKRDKLGRFTAESSWQFRQGVLDKCICDQWAVEFIKIVAHKIGKEIVVKPVELELVPTFDIDNAFAYKYKEGKRRFLSLMKDVFYRNKRRIKERNEVLSGKISDPYDSFGKILNTAKRFPVCVFWLVGDYKQPDYNISIEKNEITKLVRKLKDHLRLGIHPSFRSNKKTDLVGLEISRLEKASASEVSISRQHFLKLSFPATYQTLSKNSIAEDYTMGFADQVGFRNGTAHPFPWFDLSKNEQTTLMVYPFAYMDGTLNEYLKFSPSMAIVKIEELYNEAKKYGGQFSFIWHNETISDYGIWKGWASVFDYTLTLPSIKKK